MCWIKYVLSTAEWTRPFIRTMTENPVANMLPGFFYAQGRVRYIAALQHAARDFICPAPLFSGSSAPWTASA